MRNLVRNACTSYMVVTCGGDALLHDTQSHATGRQGSPWECWGGSWLARELSANTVTQIITQRHHNNELWNQLPILHNWRKIWSMFELVPALSLLLEIKLRKNSHSDLKQMEGFRFKSIHNMPSSPTYELPLQPMIYDVHTTGSTNLKLWFLWKEGERNFISLTRRLEFVRKKKTLPSA